MVRLVLKTYHEQTFTNTSYIILKKKTLSENGILAEGFPLNLSFITTGKNLTYKLKDV